MYSKMVKLTKSFFEIDPVLEGIPTLSMRTLSIRAHRISTLSITKLKTVTLSLWILNNTTLSILTLSIKIIQLKAKKVVLR